MILSMTLLYSAIISQDVITPLPEAYQRVNGARVEVAELFQQRKNVEALDLLLDIGKEEPWHTTVKVNTHSLAKLLGRTDIIEDVLANLETMGIAAKQDSPLMMPVGKAAIAGALAQGRLCESVYKLDDGDFLVGCVATPGVYRINEDAEAELFIPGSRLGGRSVMGLSVDRSNEQVWLSLAQVAQTPDITDKPTANGWAAFSLRDGAKISEITAPDGVTPGDIIVTQSGRVLASNSQAGALYQLSDGTAERVINVDGRASFQGISEADDGTLYIADYTNGIWQWSGAAVDQARIMVTPYLLAGIDGLVWHDGALFGIRNGFFPHQVVSYKITGHKLTQGRVLASNLPEFSEPTTGVVHDGQLYFIANSQWPIFGEKGVLKTNKKASPTLILQIDLSEVGE